MVEHVFRKDGVVGSTPIFGFVDIDAKYNLLTDQIKSHGKVALAYSGGVDSTFLLKVLIDTLGSENVLACICVSELMSQSKFEQAQKQAADIGVDLIRLDFDILSDRDFIANTRYKCYICKKKIYGLIRETAAKRGFDVIASGTNADDLADYRPGNKAAKEFGVVDPIAEAGMNKDDVRKMSFRLGLPTATVPSSPCYASRIPYGQKITAEKLEQVGKAEEFLKKLKFVQLRVRHYGDMAKIEVEQNDFEKVISEPVRTMIVKEFAEIGFKNVVMDLKGFRSGALNEDLNL